MTRSPNPNPNPNLRSNPDEVPHSLTRSIATASTGGGAAHNQCQMSVGSHDDVQRQYTQQHRITYQAYSPLRHVQFSNPVLSGVARAHGVTVAQVCPCL